jgi:hypothetical protein
VAARGNSAIRAYILKTIKDAIGSSEAVKDPCVMLPENNLQKVSFIIMFYTNLINTGYPCQLFGLSGR